MDVEKIRADLLQEMKATKGARFNAAKRLERRDRRIISVTAFASVYVIVLTVLPLFFSLGPVVVNSANAVTIVFSLVILAASLLQYSNNDPVRAEQHHRCALEINALRRELRATETPTADSVLEFGRKYDEIIRRYSVNHDDVDFEKYKTEHPDEYPNPQGAGAGTSASVSIERNWVEWAVGTMTFAVFSITVAATAKDVFDIMAKLFDKAVR